MNSFWYVIKIIPGKERTVSDYFNQQIKLGKITNILRFLCPTEDEYVAHKNKKVLREKVIYGGYLYFETNKKLNEDELKNISSYPNVMGMMGDKTPILMRESDVKKIIKDEILLERGELKKLKYCVGDNVLS